MKFFDKLQGRILQNQSLLFVPLDPNPEILSTSSTTKDILTELEAWLKLIITETADLVCAYKPTLGFYQALGIAGLELLQRTLAIIPHHIPIILDAKHGDLNTSGVMASQAFTQWEVDAITLTAYTGQDHVAPFLLYPDKAVFILCSTSNPGAEALQQYPNSKSPLYLQIAKEAKNWGTPEQLCLEVGTTNPEVLARVRGAVPERIIMARSIWTEGTELNEILKAGLNDYGEGLLIPVPQDMLLQPKLAENINFLRAEIEASKTEIISHHNTCDMWVSDVCLLNKPSP